MYQRYNIALFGSKSERAQYGNGQKGKEDGKNKRDGENGKDERGGGDHQGNKVDPMVEKSSGFEASDYYHIIY